MQDPASPPREELSSPPRRPPTRSGGLWAGLGVAAVAVLAKAKVALVALKALKLGKIALTMGSMFTMIAVYAMRGGWWFAVGFVVMLLVHELGHGVAIKRAGLEAGYPVFIPFVGAMIALRGQPRSSLEEARIAIAGPVAGTGAAIAMAAVWLATREHLWLSLAYTGFFLNLFNMTPLAPLDGGRVAQMFSRKAWIVGIVVMGAIFLTTFTPQLLLIGIMALTHLRSRGTAPLPEEASVTPADRRGMAVWYFGLCAFLALGMYLAHDLLTR